MAGEVKAVGRATGKAWGFGEGGASSTREVLRGVKERKKLRQTKRHDCTGGERKKKTQGGEEVLQQGKGLCKLESKKASAGSEGKVEREEKGWDVHLQGGGGGGKCARGETGWGAAGRCLARARCSKRGGTVGRDFGTALQSISR